MKGKSTIIRRQIGVQGGALKSVVLAPENGQKTNSIDASLFIGKYDANISGYKMQTEPCE